MSDSVETRVKELETAQDGIKHFLFGNGQPGFVAEIRKGFADIQQYMAAENAVKNDRDRKVNLLIGVLTAVAIAIGSLAAVLALNHPSRAQSVLQNLSTSQYHYDVAERSTK